MGRDLRRSLEEFKDMAEVYRDVVRKEEPSGNALIAFIRSLDVVMDSDMGDLKDRASARGLEGCGDLDLAFVEMIEAIDRPIDEMDAPIQRNVRQKRTVARDRIGNC
jgi:hypothetical protein